MANKFLGEAGLGVLVEEIKKKSATESQYNIDRIISAIEFGVSVAQTKNENLLPPILYKFVLFLNAAPINQDYSNWPAYDDTLGYDGVSPFLLGILQHINSPLDETITFNGETFSTHYDIYKKLDPICLYGFGFTKEPGECIDEITAPEVTDKFNS